MSSDPHAPTPAGPDPDDAADPFAPSQGEAASVEPDAPATLEAPATEPPPTSLVAETSPEAPPGAAAPESDWLEPDAGAVPVAPEPDPVVQTPSAFTPLGTPEPGIAEKAQALKEKPEAMVGAAFLGGAAASFLLKRLGR